MIKLIKRLFCRHKPWFIKACHIEKQISIDDLIYFNLGYNSIKYYQCKNCHKTWKSKNDNAKLD